jgi:hypothetical protein
MDQWNMEIKRREDIQRDHWHNNILTVEQVSDECSLGSMCVCKVCVIHHIWYVKHTKINQ